MTSGKCCLAFTAMILCTVFGRADAATDPLSNANRLPESLETVIRKVAGELAGNGYEVQRGYWALWGSDQCKYTVRVLGRCFGPNPTAPHALPFLPPWRDEYVDQTLHNVFGPARRGFSPIFRLAETEALVIMAELPPPGSYLGLQTYVFTRQAEINKNDEIFLTLSEDLREILFATSPNPSRLIVWSTVGDSNNHVVIEHQTEESWKSHQQRFFIVTPDQATEGDVAEALMAAGVERKQIFVEKVAADLVALGLDSAADDFQMVLRYVQVPNTRDGDARRARLPLLDFHARPGHRGSDQRRPCVYAAPEKAS